MLISSVTEIDSMMVLSIVPYLMFLPFINAASVDSLKNGPFGMIFVGAFCIAIGSLSPTLGFGQLISEMFVPLLQNHTEVFAVSAYYSSSWYFY